MPNSNGPVFDEELGRFNCWTYTPLQFKARYRFPKEVVAELVQDYWDSGWCSLKKPVATRAQMGPDERVRYISFSSVHEYAQRFCSAGRAAKGSPA